MAKTWRGVLLVAVLTVLATGCLVKDRTDTWYLDPNGAVTWSVMEKDVRSDAKAVVDRQAEEATYMAEVRTQTHPVANGLRSLGAAEIRTKILRGTPPYSVVTEAEFSGLDVLGQRFIQRAGLTGSSVVERDAVGATWTLTFRDPRAQDATTQNDDALNALTEGLDSLEITLTDGHFVAAGTDGFDLSGDGRVATVANGFVDAKAPDAAGMTVKRLQWTLR